MKTAALFAVAFSALVAGASFDASAEPYCSLETLKGSYIYSIQGYREGKPYASSGLMSFNGAGRLAIIYTSSVERTEIALGGSYTVNGNCSGSITYESTPPTVNNFYLSPSGDSFTFVRISGDGVIGTESRRVTRKLVLTP